MSQQLLQEVNRLYDLERDSLERVLAQDPVYADLVGAVARAEARLLREMDPEQALALKESRRLLLEMAIEAAFKMGYLYAHTRPQDEEAGLAG